MDWHFVIPHLVSGYLPLTAVSALYFLLLKKSGNRPGAGHVVLTFVFCFYLTSLLTLTGICLKPAFAPDIVYIPFADMIKGPVDTALNVLLFVPLGFFLPLLYEDRGEIGKTAVTGFLVSLSVELIQMFGFGTTDINDLITNTAGTCLGYAAYKALAKALPKAWIRQFRGRGKPCKHEFLSFWACSILIMLTVQLYIFHTFFAPDISGGEIQVWN